MATFSLLTSSIMLLSFLQVLSTTDLATAAANPVASFIRTSCSATTYSKVCFQSLQRYASSIQRNPRKLVMTALSVSEERTLLNRAFVSKLSKIRVKPGLYTAIKDCSEGLNDGVDRLTKSVQELKRLGHDRGPEYTRHKSNLQTWVRAALTDILTCFKGFEDRALNGRIKKSMRTRMTKLARVINNALVLCNQL